MKKLWSKQIGWSYIFSKIVICFMNADSEIWKYSVDELKFRLKEVHDFLRVTRGTYNYVSCG